MREAHKLGLRTYSMFYPLLPGIANDPLQVSEFVELSQELGAEEIFVEPVNSRGPGLRLVEDALRNAGFKDEADQVSAIRKQSGWSKYTVDLLRCLQEYLCQRNSLEKLRFFLYPKNLSESDKNWIRAHPHGVKWLGNGKMKKQ